MENEGFIPEEATEDHPVTPEAEIVSIPSQAEKVEVADPTEVPTEDGKGVELHGKILFHGSGTRGIESINVAEEDTIGSGVYFTSRREDAESYAQLRAQHTKDGEPVVYEATVDELRLLDLRNEDNAKEVLQGFRQVLAEKLQEEIRTGSPREIRMELLSRPIALIDSGAVGAGNLKSVTFNHTKTFSEYVKSLGYDGLVAIEGGEAGMQNHDSYLIFDPGRARLKKGLDRES